MAYSEVDEHPYPQFFDATIAGSPHIIAQGSTKLSWWIVSNDAGAAATLEMRETVGGARILKIQVPSKTTLVFPGMTAPSRAGTIELVVLGGDLDVTLGFPIRDGAS